MALERCKNHEIKVYGSAAKPYTVTMKMQGGSMLPFCTCPAFAIGKNRALSKRTDIKPGQPWCKHLEGQFDHLCFWQGEPLISGICDACSGPTEIVTEDSDVRH